ncbi:hypothetical protein P3S67_011846 [Capsicum chacoense]
MPFVRTLIHKPIQTKATLRGNRKDINQPVSKKSIPVQSPDPSLFSSEDEDGVVSKEVFDKFCEKVWQEFNDVCGLVSSRFDRMMNAINENKPPADENVKSTSLHQATTKFVHEFNKNPEGTLVAEEMAGYQSNNMNDVYNEIDGYNEDNDIVLEKTDIDVHEARDVCVAPNTKSVDKRIGDTQISEFQFKFSDDILRSIDLNSITKANVEVEDELKITLPDELLPSLIVYVNLERSIIVHPSTNQAQQTSMHVSRIRRPSRYNESPFTMKFGSADVSTEEKWRTFDQKYPFISHPVNAIKDTKATNKFMTWLLWIFLNIIRRGTTKKNII